ncbi:hypothetical protein [Reyranella sp.]|uniref:hypothetical protein n=1 Tax=Reyranella sp. TaxID=1929291 RepID=UPI004035BFF9
MRTLIFVALLSLAACSINSQYSEPWTVRTVKHSYDARDACLVKYAAPYAVDGSDASSVGRTVSANCEAETNALIASSNPHKDPTVTAAIRQDSEFRATGFVLKARGQYN